MPGVWRPSKVKSGESGAAWNEHVLSWLIEKKPRHLILCARWSVNLDGRPSGSLDPVIAPLGMSNIEPSLTYRVLAEALGNLLRRCEAIGTKVWILKEVPYQPRTPEQRIAWAHLFKEELNVKGVSLAQHERHQLTVEKTFQILDFPSLRFVELATPFFAEDRHSRVLGGGQSYYRDDDHISNAGARAMLYPVLSDLFSEIKLIEQASEDEF